MKLKFTVLSLVLFLAGFCAQAKSFTIEFKKDLYGSLDYYEESDFFEPASVEYVNSLFGSCWYGSYGNGVKLGEYDRPQNKVLDGYLTIWLNADYQVNASKLIVTATYDPEEYYYGTFKIGNDTKEMYDAVDHVFEFPQDATNILRYITIESEMAPVIIKSIEAVYNEEEPEEDPVAGVPTFTVGDKEYISDSEASIEAGEKILINASTESAVVYYTTDCTQPDHTDNYTQRYDPEQGISFDRAGHYTVHAIETLQGRDGETVVGETATLHVAIAPTAQAYNYHHDFTVLPPELSGAAWSNQGNYTMNLSGIDWNLKYTSDAGVEVKFSEEEPSIHDSGVRLKPDYTGANIEVSLSADFGDVTFKSAELVVNIWSDNYQDYQIIDAEAIIDNITVSSNYSYLRAYNSVETFPEGTDPIKFENLNKDGHEIKFKVYPSNPYNITTSDFVISSISVEYETAGGDVFVVTPALIADGVTCRDSEISLDDRDNGCVMIDMVAPKGVDVYYRWEPLSSLQVMALDEDGFERHSNTLTLNSPGTLSYYAVDSEHGAKSDMRSLTITQLAGTPTGIMPIETDSANDRVEYYNLQGVKIDNPSSGLFIRRQGSSVSKVIIK